MISARRRKYLASPLVRARSILRASLRVAAGSTHNPEYRGELPKTAKPKHVGTLVHVAVKFISRCLQNEDGSYFDRIVGDRFWGGAKKYANSGRAHERERVASRRANVSAVGNPSVWHSQPGVTALRLRESRESYRRELKRLKEERRDGAFIARIAVLRPRGSLC